MASETKVAKMFALISISFLLSWTPVLYLTSVISAITDRNTVEMLSPVWLLDFSLFTVALGSAVNPIVYSFFKPDFRGIIKKRFPNRTPSSTLKQDSTYVIDVAVIVKNLKNEKHGKETDL